MSTSSSACPGCRRRDALIEQLQARLAQLEAENGRLRALERSSTFFLVNGVRYVARPFPWKCRTCGEQRVKPAVVDYSAEMDHDGRAYSITVPQLEIFECEACKTRILTDAAHKKLANALRAEAGLLMPEEIRANREALGLTQKQIATLLQIAESTVSRWETGGQIQQRAMDLLLRGFFNVPTLRWYCAVLAGLVPTGVAGTLTINISNPVVLRSGDTILVEVGSGWQSNPGSPVPVPIVERMRGLSYSQGATSYGSLDRFQGRELIYRLK
jgi:putative zinc finger/helix-turn-helix YgiT family protein